MGEGVVYPFSLTALKRASFNPKSLNDIYNVYEKTTMVFFLNSAANVHRLIVS